MPTAAEVLHRLKSLNPFGYVFLNTLGGPRDRRYVQRAFEQAVERAALPVTAEGKVVFHSLRHTAISRLANDPRVGLVYAQRFAGHVDVKTTQAYVQKIESAATTSAAAEAIAG